MTSLLATQLNQLRIPEGQGADADYRRRKSLIYSPLELNKIDAAAHLERAQKAFRHLLNVDASLEEFYDCFFSEERLNFEPSMQTPDQKVALNQFVEHFYIRVSQHLLLGVTLEALEWLVYRFQTHLYNMDSMLQAVLPYHSTNLFPKFLQLFDFTAHNKRWHWLRPLANQGLALTRTELVRMASRDESLLNFVCQLVQRALKVFGPEEARLQLFVNLYAQVTLGVLMNPLDEARLTKCVNCLNFYILKGMRSSVGCYRHAAYQIVQLLALKHQLGRSVLHIWIKRLLKSSCKYEPSEVCLLVAALCSTQACQVPDELAEKFLTLCSECNSRVPDDFPEIVARSTDAVDIMFDDAPAADVDMSANGDDQQVDEVAKDAADVAKNDDGAAKASSGEAAKDADHSTDAAVPDVPEATTDASKSPTKDAKGDNADNNDKKQADSLRSNTEAALMQFLLLSGTPAASASAPDAATAAATAATSPSSGPQLAASPLLVVGCLVRLLASPVQAVRREAVQCLRAFLAKARPASGEVGGGGGPSDESEEDALIWDTAEAVVAEARAIERDQQWVTMRQQLAPACSRLVWLSVAELLDCCCFGGDSREADELQRPSRLQLRCLLGHVAFLSDAQLVKFASDSPDATVQLLLRLLRLPDASVAKAVAMKVSPALFNRLSGSLKLTYLLDGLGSTRLTDDPEILTLASAYAIEASVYLDSLANLFGLVPTKASIQDLSAKRKSLSPGNVYIDMSDQCKRQTRFLFKLMSCDRSDKLENGLQLVIRLLDVLQILVQAHSRERPSSSADNDADAVSTGVVADIGLCLLSAERTADRTPDDDARSSGLADLIPVSAVLDCARAVPDRRCQYAAVSLLCRLCRRAPTSAAACCCELLEFLARGGFFGRSDRYSAELWHGLVASVLPAYARCYPSSGVPLLKQLLGAYDDMSPSRRPELFAQLVAPLGAGAYLWPLLLLLNCRRHRRSAVADKQQHRRQQQRRQRPSADEGEDAKPPPSRRRRLSVSASASADESTGEASSQQQQQQFDSLGCSVLAAFPVPQQLLACAGLLRHLLRRLAAPSQSSEAVNARSISCLGEAPEEDLLAAEPTADDLVIDDELTEAAAVAEAELPAQLESALALVGAHLGRRDLLEGMSSDASSAAMTRLLGVLVDALLWSTSTTVAASSSPQLSGGHQRQLATACMRAIERAETAVPGASFLRVVNGLLARPEPPVRRKALDLMLSKLTGLDRSCVPLLRASLLDCLAGVEKNCANSQVALICGRELVRLLGPTEPQLVLKFCLGAAASGRLTEQPPSQDSSLSSAGGVNWDAFGCALLVCAEAVRQMGVGALPLVAQVAPRLLPWLRCGPDEQQEQQQQPQPPGVVLLAAYAFLQHCCSTMCDLMVPYLPQLLPTTVHYMLVGDSQLRPKLSSVLASVARGVHLSQLLPVMQECLRQAECQDDGEPQHRQQRWLPAEHWARLLRLGLQASAGAADDTDTAAAESLADFEAELTDLACRLLDIVAASGADTAEEDDAEDKAQGRLVAQLAACLVPLPPASRAVLLQSLQDWASGSDSREAALHRLLAVALTASAAATAAADVRRRGRGSRQQRSAGGGASSRAPASSSRVDGVPGLASLLCELDAPQHAAALLEAQSRPAGRPDCRLLRWLLACLAALFSAGCLSLDLLDSLGCLLVDCLVAAPDAGLVTRHLLPCMTAYAEAAAGDEALLKPLLRRLCDSGCRCADSANVRHWSLLAVQALLDALGDVFIDSLAADCVPTLAELAEDDSEEVERLAQRLLAEFERRAGEPLEL